MEQGSFATVEEESNQDVQMQDQQTERLAVAEDTDQHLEGELASTGFAKFHEQSKQIANRQSELDTKLDRLEQTVEQETGVQ